MNSSSLFTILILCLLSLIVKAQQDPAKPATILTETAGDLTVSGYSKAKMWVRTQTYKGKAKNSVYTVVLKDTHTLEATSKILFDTETGDCFLYHISGDSLSKILPNQTIKVSRINPHDISMRIEGFPAGKTWRFQILDGKIKAFSSFAKNNQPDEIQFENKRY